jgi:hypothetical protein
VPIATSTVCTAFISDTVIQRGRKGGGGGGVERENRRERGRRGRSVSKLEKEPE